MLHGSLIIPRFLCEEWYHFISSGIWCRAQNCMGFFGGVGGDNLSFLGSYPCLSQSINTNVHEQWDDMDVGGWGTLKTEWCLPKRVNTLPQFSSYHSTTRQETCLMVTSEVLKKNPKPEATGKSYVLLLWSDGLQRCNFSQFLVFPSTHLRTISIEQPGYFVIM